MTRIPAFQCRGPGAWVAAFDWLDYGEGVAASELAGRLGIKPHSATTVLNLAKKAGLVKQLAYRKWILTDKGRKNDQMPQP